jgi:hypothetical protein
VAQHQQQHYAWSMHVQEALAAQQAQSGDVAAERAALRRDLEQLLKERGTLDSLKRVVASALKTQQQVGGSLVGISCVTFCCIQDST